MVGVTGSIPVAPTIKCPEKSAVLANFSEDDRASQCLNKPRTVPKSRTGLGKRRAKCSRKVRRCNQQKFGCGELRSARRKRHGDKYFDLHSGTQTARTIARAGAADIDDRRVFGPNLPSL